MVCWWFVAWGGFFVQSPYLLPFCRLWPDPPFPSNNPDEQDSIGYGNSVQINLSDEASKAPGSFPPARSLPQSWLPLFPGSIPPGVLDTVHRQGPKASMPLIALTAPDSCAWSYLAGHLSGAVHPTSWPSRGTGRPGIPRVRGPRSAGRPSGHLGGGCPLAM